jgi:hypothetical protein
MKSKKSSSVVGRNAQVDICPRDAGFVLSVGPVSLWLPRDAARDVVATLTRALLLDTLGARQAHGAHRDGNAHILKPAPAIAVAAPPARGPSN